MPALPRDGCQGRVTVWRRDWGREAPLVVNRCVMARPQVRYTEEHRSARNEAGQGQVSGGAVQVSIVEAASEYFFLLFNRATGGNNGAGKG